MINSLISIIVPCYNQAQYLDECLQSVLDQTYHDWECIIVNDGSPDNIEEFAQKWVEKDSRFKYFYKENGGLSSARNFGINKAEGEWILPLDCDDYVSNDYLDLASNHFTNEKLKVIYCNAFQFGVINEKLILPDFSLATLAKRNVVFCTAFFRKDDWEKVSGYDEKLRVGLEDWDFWINILKDGGTVLRLDQTCFFYRIKEDSMLSNFIISPEIEKTFRYIEQKHLSFFHDNLGTLHQLIKKNEEYAKLFELMNNRFFIKVVNKIYAIRDSFFL